MKRTLALLPALFSLSLFTTGCSDTDAEKLRRVGDKTFDRAAHLTQKVWDELGQTLLDQKPAAPEKSTDIAQRVWQRIQWDRDLANTSIKVALQDDKLLLSGNIKSEALKQHAQDVAERTLGVNKVQNDLIVKTVANSPAENKLP